MDFCFTSCQAISEMSQTSENYDESILIVVSDANLDRYGISPSSFGRVLNRGEDKVQSYVIFIGSLGNQAEVLLSKLPAGKGFVLENSSKLPEILKAIFTSSIMK